MIFLVSFFILLLPAAAEAQEQRAAASSPLTRAEIEEFLLKASIVSERQFNNYQWRISLDDGKRRHDAAVGTEAGTTPSERNSRFNVAAYELDKALELNFVPPSVERTVKGVPASVTWWVDGVLMAEMDRRRKKIEPPDAESWNQQMQAVRLLDELMANPYRNISPEHSQSILRDNSAGHSPARSQSSNLPPGACAPDVSFGELLITRDWKIWLIDHTCTFQIGKRLEHPQGLTQCDRALLGKLRS